MRRCPKLHVEKFGERVGMRFSGKTVVVTGAASGIGAAATALFAGEGAVVFASDIDVAGGQQAARADLTSWSTEPHRCQRGKN